MANYSIKDLERISGVKAHTIRIWEKRYRLVEPRRTESNIRLYCDGDVKKLLNVSILLKNGYKISRLAGLSDEDISQKIMEVTMLSHACDTKIESLVIAMIEMDEMKFEKTLNLSIIKEGFENTVFKILYPFFERVGVLWQAGSINPAQEHFITNLVKQKIYVAIDSIAAVSGPGQKKVLIFLPEWELHELGMLIYVYLIKSAGHKVIYLGQKVPEEDVIVVGDYVKPDYLLTAFATPVEIERIESYVQRLAGHFSDKKLFITGIQTSGLNGNMPSNVIRVDSATHFKQQLITQF